ncbi:MAG: hypothetical protein AAF696_26375 [Bacteroidota bacterium]
MKTQFLMKNWQICSYCSPLLFSCFFCLTFLFTSCSWTEPVSVTTRSEILDLDAPAFSGTIAFVFENDIYLFGEGYPEVKKITDSPDERKTKIALSYNKEKIAYLDAAKQVVIIDKEGNFIENVTINRGFKDLGWSPNDQTLYMLRFDELLFHGPPMDIAALDIPGFSYELESIDISQNLDVVYCYREGGFGLEAVNVVIDYKNPSRRDWSYRGLEPFRFVRMSPDGSQVLAALSATRDRDVGGNPPNEVSFFEEGQREFVLKPFLWKVHSPDLIGNDKVLYGLSPDQDRRGNVLVGNIKEGEFESYLTFFEEYSESIYLDWKP